MVLVRGIIKMRKPSSQFIYYKLLLRFCQPLKDGYLYPYLLNGCLGTLCLGFRCKSRLRLLRNFKCFLISDLSINILYHEKETFCYLAEVSFCGGDIQMYLGEYKWKSANCCVSYYTCEYNLINHACAPW